jgi:integrase
VSAKKTLGSTDSLSLAAARAAAATLRHRLDQGADVTAVTGVTPVSGGGSDKVETMVASFLELHAYRKTRPSTARATECMLNNIVLPAWRGRTIDSIRKRDVIELVESVAASDRGYLANRTLATLSKFFNWLVARDALAFSPVTGVERPCEEEPRERIIADAELRALWLACEGEGPFGQALRMLILTGARRSEISQMRWTELDPDHPVWTLPRERSKNRRAHRMPLSSQAWAIVAAMPRLVGCDFVFTRTVRRR